MPEKPLKQATYKIPLVILAILLFMSSISFFINREDLVDSFSNDIKDQKEKQELQEKIAVLEKEIKKLSLPSPPESEFTEQAPPTQPDIDLSNKTCKELDDEIQRFFNYLDNQQYMASYNLTTSSQAHFQQLIDKLLENPPIVVRETDSLFTILTNTAHFYRVLGKDNVLMLKEIIIREADILEATFSLFDQWAQTESQCQDVQTNIHLNLPKLYEYAGFFLNTLGGQAYLFRRNSHIRLLIKYYCVMVLDRANAEVINRHGIDINPPLESLINEIEIIETMISKDHYLRKLRNLQDKYHTPHYPTTEETTS